MNRYDLRIMLERIADGRTDLVLPYVEAGNPANSTDSGGVRVIQWCAYYGDVSAIRFLLSRGETLSSLGENLDLGGACFHAHWRLGQFLLENGADANFAADDTGETPLHAALSSARVGVEAVVRVLLAQGADPNKPYRAGVETGAFMRDCRTRGETPLHRAAAFSSETTIQLLLDAGARLEARDANGDSPLTWASWHARPTPILHKLCFAPFRIHPNHQGMAAYLLGKPHTT
jgi:ankyrin repeat protein